MDYFSVRGVQVSYYIKSIFALYPIFSSISGIPAFHIWQLLTYMFLHAGFMHLFLNMFALWMFGMELENNWGSKRFLFYYIACGIIAGISNLIFGPIFGQDGATIGASGAVYGILLAYGVIFPNRQIYLYFLFPIRAKYFVMLFIGLEIFAGVTGTQDGIAHFAHLGGAAGGYLLLVLEKYKYKIYHYAKDFLKIYQKPDRFTQRKADEISEAKYFDLNNIEPEELQKKLDEILDKIGKVGYQNLTEEEKKILYEASKKL
ncbi:MAG: GlpG protein (membrane protein of glp regulon) [Ignavibacteriae bacterium]|nr:MAG: GlpG protein (membrane protein of glp regulon) [Ignavibacteriota bacterium]